ncbi:MAG: creatininase family protein [Chamaesiphon sp.]|nr:creatininase family protein [Chamaesiphon sp.]
MQLHLSTWTEVEQYLQTSTGIIIPIGSTEQHGPTGLIGTDAICAEGIAAAVGIATDALVAPTINVGMALHHTSFPGTISLRPSTMILVIRDYITCLVRAGFTKFFFINGQGGNIATLKAAYSETYAHLSDLNIPNADRVECQTANWFMSGSVYRLAKELYGNLEGSHATPSEVALTQYLYPESIKSSYLDPTNLSTQRKILGAADFRRRYPDGRMGSDPSLATPEHGKQFFDLSVKDLTAGYLEFLADK